MSSYRTTTTASSATRGAPLLLLIVAAAIICGSPTADAAIWGSKVQLPLATVSSSSGWLKNHPYLLSTTMRGGSTGTSWVAFFQATTRSSSLLFQQQPAFLLTQFLIDSPLAISYLTSSTTNRSRSCSRTRKEIQKEKEEKEQSCSG